MPANWTISQGSIGSVDSIDLGGQDKVAFGQTVDLVGPDLDSDSTPSEIKIG